ncbi:extracellular solute-binding protein family 1 [Oscillochloris trichoides DG-6]|uniref:Extracellular solute-binding protein family 1 n=1 Tax=Oscillochloris trichoides DG-6 TaxID=765420 RepID=E1IDH8_9CHLR|nr:extracellular solute-binding protein family 1 [Oscillochloris trichoides DG-6]
MFALLALLLTACGGTPAASPTTAPAVTTAPAADATTPPTDATAPATDATTPPTDATAPATDATTAPAGEVKITIWHQWDGKYVDAIQAAFDAYEASHPGVTIDLSKPDDVNNALLVAVPAGEGPDIIGWANDQIGQSALAGNIVPLDDYGITQEFLSSTYEPAAVNGVVWQEKIWGLPESQEGIALIYNKALVAEADLPTSLDDLLAKATAFKDANPDKTYVCNQGFGTADAYHVAPVYFGFGVPAYVDAEGMAYVNTPEMIKGGEWLAAMSKVSLSEQSYDICKAALAEGKVAMWWTGPWAIAGIEEDGVDYGILSMGKPFVGIKTLLLTKNAVDRGNAEVALDIMKYFTSAEVQKTIALANKTIPAATAAVQDAEIQALPTLAGFGQAMNAGVPMANTPFASAQWTPVGDASIAIFSGAQAPADALAAAQAAIEDAISQMK